MEAGIFTGKLFQSCDQVPPAGWPEQQKPVVSGFWGSKAQFTVSQGWVLLRAPRAGSLGPPTVPDSGHSSRSHGILSVCLRFPNFP